MTSPSPHLFDDPIWSMRDAVGWVLDRDPGKFGRFWAEEDLKGALFGALLYTRYPRPSTRRRP